MLAISMDDNDTQSLSTLLSSVSVRLFPQPLLDDLLQHYFGCQLTYDTRTFISNYLLFGFWFLVSHSFWISSLLCLSGGGDCGGGYGGSLLLLISKKCLIFSISRVFKTSKLVGKIVMRYAYNVPK